MKDFPVFPRQFFENIWLLGGNIDKLSDLQFNGNFDKECNEYCALLGQTNKLKDLTNSLENSNDNRIKPRDILTQMLLELRGLKDFERRLLKFVGRRRTAIVTLIITNACTIHKLFTAYAIGLTGVGSINYLMQLTDGGLLKLAFLARNIVNWRFGIENLVLETLDIESSGRLSAVGQLLRKPRI